MRIAIIELLTDETPTGWGLRLYDFYFRKQGASITPQAIAVWCRSLGHDVCYATYYGQGDPIDLVPPDADVLFVACYTQFSALAYALATIFRRQRALTVIGGPHARAFPTDCSRFFDVVVKDCDKGLIEDILKRRFDPPAIVSTGRPLTEFPTVEERMPEIKTAAFHRGRPMATSVVPVLASIGCPYSCGFCVDWNTRYLALPRERIAADLRYLARHWPQLIVGYHDPNFAVRFDDMMAIIEELPEANRNRYVMESSLSILKEDRLHRLRTTGCIYVAPGIESWLQYTNKLGAGFRQGREKFDHVVSRLEVLSAHVSGVQANFVFGDELDEGDEPAELTIEFVKRLPQVWPSINIPVPFAGTPLHDQLSRESRLLPELPFMFYCAPYLAMIIKHYDTVTYYSHLVAIHEAITSQAMLLRRFGTNTSLLVRAFHAVRTLSSKAVLRELRWMCNSLIEDSALRAFHEGRSRRLPDLYHVLFERRLGRYAELLPRRLRHPVFESVSAQAIAAQ